MTNMKNTGWKAAGGVGWGGGGGVKLDFTFKSLVFLADFAWRNINPKQDIF